VDWAIKSRGAIPDVGRLLSGAERLLGGQKVAVVAVDMPLSTEPITGRREADAAISKAYGSRGAAVHSPSSERPGAISDELSKGFAAAGYPLATATTPVGTPNCVAEGYPHPALMTLTGAEYRLPYKVSRSRRYWPESCPAERKANLLAQFGEIASALKGEIRDIPIELPGPDSVVSTAGLKRYEDSLDALVCAWVGAKYLEGEAVPYGDSTAAIWVPQNRLSVL
jgi:predicted RNase H-like nuclease